jgi:hypothetical protein
VSFREQAAGLSSPRWDGSRVLFEIAVGGDRVACAISRSALEDLGQRRHLKPADLLLHFARARERIAAIARAKLLARGGDHTGTIGVWSDDIEDFPPAA